jgi:hypothetical protein
MEQDKELFALWTLLEFWGSCGWVGTQVIGPHERQSSIDRWGRQQHEDSAVPCLRAARAEASEISVWMRMDKGILFSIIQLSNLVGEQQIRGPPAGASGDNNTRFASRRLSSQTST